MSQNHDYQRAFCEQAIALNLGLSPHSAEMEEVRRLGFHAAVPRAELLPEQLAAAHDMTQYHANLWAELMIDGAELLALRVKSPAPSLAELIQGREGMTVERAELAIAAYFEEQTQRQFHSQASRNDDSEA